MGEVRINPTLHVRNQGPYNLLYNGYRVPSLWVKRPWFGVDHPPYIVLRLNNCSAVLLCRSVSSWWVVGRNLLYCPWSNQMHNTNLSHLCTVTRYLCRPVGMKICTGLWTRSYGVCHGAAMSSEIIFRIERLLLKQDRQSTYNVTP